jgi:hypothetical protein
MKLFGAVVLGVIVLLGVRYAIQEGFRSALTSITSDQAACLSLSGSTTAVENGNTDIIGTIKNDCDRKFSQVTVSFKLDRSSSDSAAAEISKSFDVRHLVTFDYYYELPLGLLTAAPRALREGWILGGITTVRTGTPYDVQTGSNVGDGIHVQRPDIVCKNPSTGTSVGLFAQVLSPSCFTRPGMDPSTGFFVGNLARNAVYAPGSVNFDFNISKNTRLGERFTHQLRAEFFNALNTPNFGAPVNQLSNPNFGRILGAGSGREIQFAMKLIF